MKLLFLQNGRLKRLSSRMRKLERYSNTLTYEQRHYIGALVLKMVAGTFMVAPAGFQSNDSTDPIVRALPPPLLVDCRFILGGY